MTIKSAERQMILVVLMTSSQSSLRKFEISRTRMQCADPFRKGSLVLWALQIKVCGSARCSSVAVVRAG
jgi:hypothetical protein